MVFLFSSRVATQPAAPSRLGPVYVLQLCIAFAFLGGCLLGVPRDEPSAVVIEGQVVEGDTFRLDPLDEMLPTDTDSGVPATIRLENESGPVLEVEADESGRFRLGPVRWGDESSDRIVITSPGRRALCLSALLPGQAGRADDRTGPDGVVTVRWRVVLPRMPA